MTEPLDDPYHHQNSPLQLSSHTERSLKTEAGEKYTYTTWISTAHPILEKFLYTKHWASQQQLLKTQPSAQPKKPQTSESACTPGALAACRPVLQCTGVVPEITDTAHPNKLMQTSPQKTFAVKATHPMQSKPLAHWTDHPCLGRGVMNVMSGIHICCALLCRGRRRVIAASTTATPGGWLHCLHGEFWQVPEQQLWPGSQHPATPQHVLAGGQQKSPGQHVLPV